MGHEKNSTRFKYSAIYDFSKAVSYLKIKLAGALLVIPLLFFK